MREPSWTANNISLQCAAFKLPWLPEMSDPSVTLTQPELLALALEAARRDDGGRSLAYLKEAVARPDASAEALFMLGSEYAQLGLLPDAKAFMARAIEVSPDLHIARFQFGLLQLTSGEPEAAQAIWAPLAALDEAHPQHYLQSFHRGLISLIADKFDAAVEAIQEGLRLNQSNEPLNADMRRILDAVEHLPGRDSASRASQLGALAGAHRAEPIAAADDKAAEPELEPSHLFINAYTHRGKPH